MARRLIALATLAVLVACGSAAAHSSAGAASAPCGPARGHTLATSSQARAYSLDGNVYGCTRGGPRWRLGSASRCIGAVHVGPVALTGRLAAYAAQRCGVDTGSSSVLVRRLADGRQLSAYPASSLMLGPESFTSVGSLVVDANGQVAWIASVFSIGSHRHGVQVFTAGRSGTHLLDSSLNVALGSLRRSGDKLIWRDGSVTRSARLG